MFGMMPWGSGNALDPLLLMHMDGPNNSTTVVDSSANGFVATVQNEAKISTTQSVFGGSSLFIPVSGDCVVVPSDPRLNLVNGGTVDVRFWLGGSPDYKAIVSKWVDTSRSWYIGCTPDNKIVVARRISGDYGNYYTSALPFLNAEVFNHMRVHFFANDPYVVLFVNGSKVLMDIGTYHYVPDGGGIADLVIGATNDFNSYAAGCYIDELAIFDYQLSGYTESSIVVPSSPWTVSSPP